MYKKSSIFSMNFNNTSMNTLRDFKVILIFGLFLALLSSCKKEEKVALPPIQAPFVVIKPKDVPIYKEFAAQTFGDLDIELKARVDGILTGIHFKEGQRVKKGQLLYTIDPLEYDTKVEQIKGQVASSQSMLVNAEEELKRIKPLADMNAVSKRELDAAVAKAKAAKSNYESMRAALSNQQLERSYCNIVSPIDGIIGISIGRIGDYISKMGTTSKLNTVSRLDKVRVRFTISESEFLQYQRTNKNSNNTHLTDLELLLSDGTTHPYKGAINFSDASIDSTTGTMTIEAQFPNPENNLRSGQFSKVRILVQTQKAAVVVPQKAVTEIQGIFQVSIIDNANKIQVQIVEVGAKVGTDWIITKGLKLEDKVAIVGSQFIQPGTVIQPVPYVLEDKTSASLQNK
jgi:membrane fusion protein (multidrug efflux system)